MLNLHFIMRPEKCQGREGGTAATCALERSLPDMKGKRLEEVRWGERPWEAAIRQKGMG